MKKTVLVLFGGNSSEYDVSLVSAANVIRNISTDKYDILTLGITREGGWRLFDGPTQDIENDSWINGKLTKAVFSPDPADGGLLVFGEDGVRTIKIDVVFPVLHGKNGEDGTVQGLLELSGVPYVGCGHLASAAAMDKQFTNLIADFYGVTQAKWRAALKTDYAQNAAEILDAAERELSYPIFVKPANAGSSVGISKAHNRAELEKAATLAFTVDRKIIFEQTIVGKEVECAVLGNASPVASVVGEIAPAAEFYDYDAKYVSDSKLFIPARLPQETAERIRRAAVKIFKALDCAGLSRVDFFAAADGEIYFNEINTIPGFTSISMYPKLFAEAGVPYAALIDRLLELAVERKSKA